MNIEDEFPGSLDKKDLIERGGEQITKMTYFKLENKEKTKIGIYEPFYEKGKEVKSYSLRKIIDKESLIKIFDKK